VADDIRASIHAGGIASVRMRRSVPASPEGPAGFVLESAAPPLQYRPGMHPGCRVCREIEAAPLRVLYLYMVLVWTPFSTRRMTRFLFDHDFGCDERFRWS
jgi:hypothetical protein